MNSTERKVILIGVIVAIVGVILYSTPVKEITISNGRKPRAPLPLLMVGIGISIIYCVFKMHKDKEK